MPPKETNTNPSKKIGNLILKYSSSLYPIQPATPMVPKNCRPKLLYFKKALSGSLSAIVSKKKAAGEITRGSVSIK